MIRRRVTAPDGTRQWATGEEVAEKRSMVRRELARVWRQLPLVVWLLILWLLLWEDVTLLSVVSGAVLAILITRVLYLPPVELGGRFNLLAAIVFLGRFIGDLVWASFQVAWKAIDPRGVPNNSIIAVDLRTRSDLTLTLTSLAVSLVPGSLVVEADRNAGILYLHVLDTENQVDIEAARTSVIRTEERIIKAIGSREEIRRVNAARAQAGEPPLLSGRHQAAYEKLWAGGVAAGERVEERVEEPVEATPDFRAAQPSPQAQASPQAQPSPQAQRRSDTP